MNLTQKTLDFTLFHKLSDIIAFCYYSPSLEEWQLRNVEFKGATYIIFM